MRQSIVLMLLACLAFLGSVSAVSGYTLDSEHALYSNMKGIYVFDNRADDGNNIAGTGTMVGTTEDADGFDTPITQSFQSWYNDFGSAYTICVWHDGMTLAAYGAIVEFWSSGDGSALVWQRDNANDRIRIYHSGSYQTLSTLNMADIGSSQMLALAWNTTSDDAYAYDDGVSLGSQEQATNPSTSMSDAVLTVGGDCTVTRVYIFDAHIGATALLALTSDPNSIFESEAPLPKATTPSPADEATDVAIASLLSWAAADGALNYNVYFGLDANDINDLYVSNVTDPNYDPTMIYETGYQWRIDPNTATQTTTGDVWTFTSVAEPAAPEPAAPTGWHVSPPAWNKNGSAWQKQTGLVGWNKR